MAFIYEFSFKIHSVIDNLNEVGVIEGDPEISIMTLDGFLKREDDLFTLSYTEESEGGRVVCDVTTDGKTVTLKRRGAVVFDATFVEGESIKTVYSIPPYSFDAQIKTKRIRSDISTRGGELSLLYSMNIGGQEKNVRMKITATPRSGI